MLCLVSSGFVVMGGVGFLSVEEAAGWFEGEGVLPADAFPSNFASDFVGSEVISSFVVHPGTYSHYI